MAWLQLDELNKYQVDNIKQELTIQPRKTTDIQTKEDPKPIFLFEEDDERGLIGVPRYYYLERRSGDHEEVLDVSYGKPMQDLQTNFKAEGPFAEQADALDELALALENRKWGGALLQAPPGAGKTIMALEFARRMGRRTLILVHKDFLVQQWKNRILGMMPDARVGIIKQSRCEFDELESNGDPPDFVIALLQSLSRDDGFKYPESMYSHFGTIVSDECFVKGTHVLTPDEEVPIEEIRDGDVVLNAVGHGRVKSVGSRLIDVSDLRVVSFADSTEVICTAEHPFLTNNGWVHAKDLAGCSVLTHSECIGMMRRYGTCKNSVVSDVQEAEFCEGRSEVLFEEVFWSGEAQAAGDVRVLRGGGDEAEEDKILFDILSAEMDVGEFQPFYEEAFRRCIKMAQEESAGARGSFASDESVESDVIRKGEKEGVSFFEEHGASSSGEGWKRDRNDRSSIDALGCSRERVEARGGDQNDGQARESRQISRVLQSGLGEQEEDGGCGGGRSVTQTSQSSGAGCKKRSMLNGIRVESVEVLKREDLERFAICTEGDRVRVYNLNVSGHPSYILETGAVVHNCHRVGAGSWAGIIPRFKAAWRLGVTATPRRKDGSQDVFFKHISPITYSVHTKMMRPKLRRVITDSTLKRISRGKYQVSIDNLNSGQIVNQLAADKFRTRHIVDDMVKAVQAGRKLMVVSERLEHLKEMAEQLGGILFGLDLDFVPRIDFYTGQWFSGEVWKETKRGKRGNILHRKGEMKLKNRTSEELAHAESANVIFATKQMCVDGDSIVVDADTGEPLFVRDLCGEEGVRLLSYREGVGDFVPNKIVKAWKTGVKDVLKISCGRGGDNRSVMSLSVSGDHRVMSQRGWVRSDEIVVGDWLMIPGNAQLDGKSDVEVNEAALMGYFIGDGNTSQLASGQAAFFNIDKDIVDNVSFLLSEYNAALCEKDKEPGKYRVVLGGKNGGGVKSKFRKLAESHGLDGCRAWEKKLSDRLLFCDRESAGALIAALIDTDGNVGRKKLEISHCSSSRKLAYQVQHMLLGHGIISFVRSAKRSNSVRRRRYWTVKVAGMFWIKKMMDFVGPYLMPRKRKMLSDLCKLDRAEDGVGLRIPEEQWIHAMRVLRSQGLRKKDIIGSVAVPVGGSIHRNGVHRSLLKSVADATNNEMLLEWSNSDALWVRVVSVESVRSRDVYDFTMEGESNFLCDGFVVHNCEEGLDIPSIDVLVMATPISDVEQIVGRIQRWCFPQDGKCEVACPWRAGKCKQKPQPIVVDVVDEMIVQLNPKYRRRMRFYKKLGTL